MRKQFDKIYLTATITRNSSEHLMNHDTLSFEDHLRHDSEPEFASHNRRSQYLKKFLPWTIRQDDFKARHPLKPGLQFPEGESVKGCLV
ncbi:hypothetical protein PM082_007259 [Marasmius tenuissimus]|nr:hypothetical protein PM082_007259 [Marasmius tenuissimus]